MYASFFGTGRIKHNMHCVGKGHARRAPLLEGCAVVGGSNTSIPPFASCLRYWAGMLWP